MPSLLVVDDDPLLAAMLRLVLEEEGYEVREAPDGRAALEAVKTHRPAAMVLDLMMPGLDGFAVLAGLREEGLSEDTRVMMLTCCSQEDDIRRCLALGADEYFTKPVDVDGLLDSVRDLLGIDMEVIRRRRAAVADGSVMAERVGVTKERWTA